MKELCFGFWGTLIGAAVSIFSNKDVGAYKASHYG